MDGGPITLTAGAHDSERPPARNLLDTRAEAVVSAKPGCSLQIAAHTERLGRHLPVLHPMEVLRMSIEGSAGDDGEH